MTDLELNKALALAIGWRKDQVSIQEYAGYARVECFRVEHGLQIWMPFDYREWRIVGPIAERYNAFPDRCGHGWAAAVGNSLLTWVEADTPQKAIALAVIGGVK